jgi:hypothetical protein
VDAAEQRPVLGQGHVLGLAGARDRLTRVRLHDVLQLRLDEDADPVARVVVAVLDPDVLDPRLRKDLHHVAPALLPEVLEPSPPLDHQVGADQLLEPRHVVRRPAGLDLAEELACRGLDPRRLEPDVVLGGGRARGRDAGVALRPLRPAAADRPPSCERAGDDEEQDHHEEDHEEDHSSGSGGPCPAATAAAEATSTAATEAAPAATASTSAAEAAGAAARRGERRAGHQQQEGEGELGASEKEGHARILARPPRRTNRDPLAGKDRLSIVRGRISDRRSVPGRAAEGHHRRVIPDHRPGSPG